MTTRHLIPPPNSGSALIPTLALLLILSAFVAAALTTTVSTARLSQRSRVMDQALVVGDGALQMLYADWKAQSQAYAVTNPLTPQTSFTSSSNCLPTATEFPGLQSYSAGSNKLMINPATFDVTPITLSGTSNKGQGTSAAVNTYYYKASVDVTNQALANPVTVSLRRVFEQQISNAWRYMTFYEYDLEAQPANQTIIMGGDVHTNGIFYSGAGNSLIVTGLPTTAGGFVMNWAPGDTYNSSRTPAMPDFQGGAPVVVPRQDLLGINPSQFSTTDSNVNNDNYREMIQRAVTSGAGSGTDPFAGARLYDQAGIKILIDASNNLTIRDLAGTVHTSDTFATTIKNAITTGQTFQDSREAATIRVATIDVSKITSAMNAGTLSFNGIIYISDTSASSSAKRGIRLWRGAKLPSNGLTVATDNPIYIWGDYNTGGTYSGSGTTAPSSQPSSNTDGNPPNAANTVSGYTAAPAAIFSDATTILSNNWKDNNSTKSLSSRTASNTTVNAGFATGSVATDTSTGTFGLGVEGMVRYLEDWWPSSGQRKMTYYGSFISLWRAVQATGPWSYGYFYTVPENYWYFDTHFLTSPPKPFLGVMSFSKGRWYLE